MRMKYLVLIVSLSCSVSFAASVDDFLKTGVGARALGMGGSFIAIANSPETVYWNPAGITQIEGAKVDLMYSNQFEMMTNSFLAFVHSPFGIGVIMNSVGDIPVTSEDLSGNLVTTGESTTLNQMAVLLSYAKKFGGSDKNYGLSAGATLKYVTSKMFTVDAAGTGMDIGALYKTGMGEKLDFNIGLNLLNAVAPTFENETVKGYTGMGVAFIYKIKEKSDITLAYSSIDASMFGLEWRAGNFMLRAGQGINETDFGASIIAGQDDKVQIDFGYGMHTELGNTMRASLTFKL